MKLGVTLLLTSSISALRLRQVGVTTTSPAGTAIYPGYVLDDYTNRFPVSGTEDHDEIVSDTSGTAVRPISCILCTDHELESDSTGVHPNSGLVLDA